MPTSIVLAGRDIGDGQDAHRHGVVRDFKPDNMLFRDGQAVLADFGISLLKSDDHTHTRLTPTPVRAISAIESTAA